MTNFLHTFQPQPILFKLGFLTIHWYGLFIVIAIIAGLLVVIQLAKHFNITKDEVYNLGFYLIIFGLLGGRIYAVLLDLPFYLKNPFEIIAVWHGGLAIHGAIIGGLITLIIYCRKKKLSFWLWASLLAIVLPLGQAIGRWGNYFNQELFGRPTTLPWGIPIALQNRPAEFLSSTYFHPTFLYESILNLLNFAILLFLFFWLISKKQVGKLTSLQACRLVSLVYLINYSAIRIAMEFLRTDSTPEILGLRLPILVSIGVIIVSVGVIVSKSRLTVTKE